MRSPEQEGERGLGQAERQASEQLGQKQLFWKVVDICCGWSARNRFHVLLIVDSNQNYFFMTLKFRSVFPFLPLSHLLFLSLGHWWEINSSLSVHVSTSWLQHVNINYTLNFMANNRNCLSVSDWLCVCVETGIWWVLHVCWCTFVLLCEDERSHCLTSPD